MRLQPIARQDLAGFIESVVQGYAEQKATMGGVPTDEAVRQARQETAALFPDGNLAPGHAVLLAIGDDGQQYGHLWIAPHRTERGLAFIYDVIIDAPHRGRGNGRQLMLLAHEWAREQGFSGLRLHVFGGNDAAIGLYRSLGYQVTDISMRVDL